MVLREKTGEKNIIIFLPETWMTSSWEDAIIREISRIQRPGFLRFELYLQVFEFFDHFLDSDE